MRVLERTESHTGANLSKIPFCLDLCSFLYCVLTQTETDLSLDLEGYFFVCVLFISHKKIKLGSSCTEGRYLFLTPAKWRHLVGDGEHRERRENKIQGHRVRLRWQEKTSWKN